LLLQLWAAGEPFLLIEHDIEIHERVVRSLRYCPRPWCAFPYSGPGFHSNGDPMLRESLGCTRFSAKLMRDEPDLLAVAAAMSQGLAAGDWRRMDASISPTLKQRGYVVHVHAPPVLHHHLYPNEGCACGGDHE
jgi:hypothetical protein